MKINKVFLRMKLQSIKGSILLWVVVLLIIIVLFLSISFWFFKEDLKKFTPDFNTNLIKTPAPKSSDSKLNNWKIYENPSLELSLKIPPNWYRNDDLTISEYQISRSPKKDSIYNLISITKHTGVLISGYYDHDLFYKIYNLNKDQSFTPQHFNSNSQKMIQISKGITLGGQKYVVFKNETESIVNVEKVIEIRAFVLDGNSIIIFNLLNYDESGLETFQKIISTTRLEILE